MLTGDTRRSPTSAPCTSSTCPAPRRFCYTPGFATLGYGLPAGLGAAIGRPGAPVAVLLGDGALMFSVQELVTACRATASGADHRRGQRRLPARSATSRPARGIPPIGVDLRTPDLAALAVAMGAHGARAPPRPPTCPHLVGGALDADGPTLIHLDIR